MNAQLLSRVMAALLVLPMAVAAEDIDLFVGSTPTQSADNPNVIILIDNTTNWSAQNQGWPSGATQGRYELDAIKTVINSLAPANEDAKVNLGLMFLTQGKANKSNSGGYVRTAVKPMTVANRAALSTILDGINVNDNSETVPASVGYDQAMFEVFKYFGGYTSVAKSSLNQAGGTTDATHFGAIRYSGEPDAKTDTDAFSDPTTKNNYIPVISGSSTACSGKNYLIVIGNGWPTPAEKSGNTFIGETLLGNVGGSTSQIYATSTADVRYADEMARFLYQTDVSSALGKQNVITYAIDVFKNQPSSELTALLKSMSEGVGGGKYFEANSAVEIVDSLATIMAEIQSVNSVFASVSLPVSVNTQGTYLNQVFIGMFRPDKDALPRWHGNLKQYKLAFLNGVLRLADADDSSAISSSGSGFISECARSYWTPAKTATDSYWTSIDVQNCSEPASSNTRDGNVVEKGGQGYKLRAITPASRNVKTCGTTCEATLEPFDTGNSAITKDALGNASMTDADRLDLINWARGLNTKGETFAGKSATDLAVSMRRTSHGDVVHSRPVAINYAASDTDSPQVVVFYGGNDGMLRAVNGNRDGGSNIADRAPGEEIWSFVAPESYGMFLRNRENQPKISFPNSPTGLPKAYGFDGPVVAYKDGSKAWIYATMRRGGRAVYAFDVSTAGTPKLLWKLGCTSADDTTCTSNSSDIGQTWASPVVLKSSGYQSSGIAKPMLIMGGGYDACEDSDPATSSCKSSGKGHVIYLVDAETGVIKQSFQTAGGVVGDITVAKDANGMAKFAYAADLSGNVYRISGSTANSPIGTTSPGGWTITKIAALGGTGVDARKFIYGPDVVNDNGTYVLLLGSGDREKPVGFYDDAAAVQNYFFMLKDRPTDSEWLASEGTNCAGASILCKASLFAITDRSTPAQDALDLKKGWYLALDPTEQVVTSALTIFGNVTFSTHRPRIANAAACTPDLGDARVYNVNFKNAEGKNGERYAELAGDGLPPSPVAGLVKLDNGPTVPFCIGCGSTSSLEGGEPPKPPIAVQPKARVFWNIEK
ncbi:PilC/PilY family type IV pilus protein [Pseudomonas sp. LFM046]|uniref:pilus assembly protein n=1 Tax=Pseudomonas sp. LFM046 TaxID=1608357 RepID=UPI000695AA00|nr:PilC/PilY family type IV pilus protein [Pseudomonas sp. LFM046]